MDLKHGDLTREIIGAAIEVHRFLGPGLLETTYRQCMLRELELRCLEAKTEVPIPIEYKGTQLRAGYRLDLIVENAVIVELKATERLAPVHQAQLLSYLRLTGKHVGLLVNFHVPVLRDGIKRVVI